MEEPILSAKSKAWINGGKVELLRDKVIIKRSDSKAREISFREIAFVQCKSNYWTDSGYIYFVPLGKEDKLGLTQRDPEYLVDFPYHQKNEFELLNQAIQHQMQQSMTVAPMSSRATSMEYCPSCGRKNDGSKFCPQCGQDQTSGAALIGDPASPIPPMPNRIQTPSAPIPSPSQQQESPGVWTGVKLGCGMFIVLPILIIVLVFVILAVLGNV